MSLNNQFISQDAFDHLAKAFNTIPFNRTLGLTLNEISNNEVSMQFAMKQELIGNYLHGILHGGVISSVLDMAGGVVVMSSLIKRFEDLSYENLAKIIGKCSTIDLQISFLNPGKGIVFTAKSFLLKSGNKVAFTRMELFNETQTLIATASGTYLMG